MRLTLRQARVVVCALCVVMLPAAGASAADKPRIFVLNTVVQGAVTVVSAAVRGKVRSPGDVLRTFASGSASGAGMYQAKVLVGRGHTAGGWLLANAAGSISENAVAGRHPFGQIGYSFGPMRFRFSMPRLDPGSDAHVLMDLSVFESIALAVAASVNERAGLRSGLIVFRRDSSYDFYEGHEPIGATAGIFPGVAEDEMYIWNHEMVHAVQSLQADMVDPPVWFLTHHPSPGTGKKWLRFGNVQIGLPNFAKISLSDRLAYEDHWEEIEAYRLANDDTPPVMTYDFAR